MMVNIVTFCAFRMWRKVSFIRKVLIINVLLEMVMNHPRSK